MAAALFMWLGSSTVPRAGSEFQSALAAESRIELAAAGLPVEGLEMDGRDVVLSGALASPEAFETARNVVLSIPGVRSVSRSEVMATAAAVRLEVTPSSIVLEGRIPNQESRESLERDARLVAGSRAVVERLVVEPGVDQPLWIEKAGALLDALVDAGGGVVRVERSVLSVRGTVATGEQRHSLVGAIRAAFPDLDIVDDVDVAEVRSEVQTAIDRAVGSRTVDFDPSGTALSPTGAEVLDVVARVLVQNPNAQVDVLVHGALRGRARASADWRRDRAERVRDYLVRRGVRSDRIRPVGGANADGRVQATGPIRVALVVVG